MICACRMLAGVYSTARRTPTASQGAGAQPPSRAWSSDGAGALPLCRAPTDRRGALATTPPPPRDHDGEALVYLRRSLSPRRSPFAIRFAGAAWLGARRSVWARAGQWWKLLGQISGWAQPTLSTLSLHQMFGTNWDLCTFIEHEAFPIVQMTWANPASERCQHDSLDEHVILIMQPSNTCYLEHHQSMVLPLSLQNRGGSSNRASYIRP
jgi:hypothetical protein